jgi:hypothetical protein
MDKEELNTGSTVATQTFASSQRDLKSTMQKTAFSFGSALLT